jgi:Monooxygenase af470-like
VATDAKIRVTRQTVDLSEYPDLVVIVLGMRVNVWTGIKTLMGIRPKIVKSVADQPDGLLLHEMFLFSLFPPHAGMRQYWRDFDSLENWARSQPHREWWQNFVRDSKGTGFWHETYFRKGGIEAVYDDMKAPVGMMRFAPLQPAHGPLFSARKRADLGGDSAIAGPVTEADDVTV